MLVIIYVFVARALTNAYNNSMTVWKWIIYIVVALVLSIGLYDLYRDNVLFGRRLSELRVGLELLESENRELEHRLEHFQEPGNLIKEVKLQFHYREVGEELIIIIPDSVQ